MSEEIRVKSTPPFKLKDNPKGRSWQGIYLVKQFGFVPEVIIIEKIKGLNNHLIVRAVLTDAEIKKENEMLAKNKTSKTNKKNEMLAKNKTLEVKK